MSFVFLGGNGSLVKGTIDQSANSTLDTEGLTPCGVVKG